MAHEGGNPEPRIVQGEGACGLSEECPLPRVLIHDQLKQIAAAEIGELGWAKGLETAKEAWSEGSHSNCATGLHSLKGRTGHQPQEEVHEHFTGEDYEPYETMYVRLNASRSRTVEGAL